MFLLGDKVTLKYGSFTFPVRTISPLDIGNRRDLVFTLTAADIVNVGSGTHILQYSITRAVVGNPDETENTSLAPPQDVLVMGSDQLPGGGALPDGGYDPINDRNAIGPTEAIRGVRFVTRWYRNKAVGDVITLNFVQTRGVPHNPAETPVEETRIQLRHTVGPDEVEEDKTTDFPLDAQTLMQLRALCHADATWTATNGFGTVANENNRVIVDSRGWTGTDKTEETDKTKL
ncbi:hypothetical protein D3C77_529490 [compost metagenome]